MNSSPRDAAPQGLAAVRRVDYSGDGLVESDVAASPYLQARAWVDDAVAAAEERDDVPEPTAISVATVDATGTPDVRTVLMRFLDERGPGFVTNLDSAKSEHLKANPRVAAALTWPSLYRAIRFRGSAELVGRDEVEAYFDSRPYGSRLSAWASDQSRPAEDRHQLERKWQEVLERFPDTGSDHDVPVPDFWGGWRIVCDEVEFWAGRRNRLHDRIVFRRTGDGDLADAASWTRLRLQP
ncbi:pyridoxine/pyridoxamine 5'-phosphate oxidase [Terrabacter tumescens]|uniref:Pyridoxine/pyridoxamine 5'-phosphate oxidase n=1 Tax=Terrabacter tumescens TaxID=60443 RepID=A0ABQ2I2H1_9MICO|nr:pyridoxamine 5'-phosphate oxidase [Terrabacter tumescens]GGM96488.1 pyridoxine/pyridoxamine 5'-phosphate oxidase [Terrabacter tumescens]